MGTERKRVAYSFPLSFFASPLAFAEKNYIRILFVIKSLENIKRNFVTKQEICPSGMRTALLLISEANDVEICARPEKNRLTSQLNLNSQSWRHTREVLKESSQT